MATLTEVMLKEVIIITMEATVVRPQNRRVTCLMFHPKIEWPLLAHPRPLKTPWTSVPITEDTPPPDPLLPLEARPDQLPVLKSKKK